jgi:hypothetical protein
MKPLGGNLKPQEQEALAHMTYVPGFPILVRLMEEACSQAVAEVIKVNPADPKYNEMLKSTQLEARAMSEFSNALIKSMGYHVRVAEAVIKAKEEAALAGPEEPRAAGTVSPDAAIGNPLARRKK